MRGAERSAGNTAKNIALIVLAVLMAVLCAANWLAGVSAASLGSDNPLRRVHDRLFGGAAGGGGSALPGHGTGRAVG